MERTQPLALGEALKRARLAADLTQEALAERSGISIRTIRNLERGTLRRPRQDTRRLLEAALGLTALDLAPTPAARQSNATAAAPSPLREASRRPLPIPPTPLIGRALEVEAACALLRRPEVRLLTVCGPPGVGKTRVALEVAAQLQPEFADGVVFVPLAPIRDPSLVVSALAQALGLHERSADTLVEQVQQHLQQRSLLLLLDNFEQIASAAPLIAELLATCQQLHLLVTSRVPLHMRGEQEYPLAPLPLPDLPAVSDLETLAQVPSVALLLQRAQAVQPTFALTETNAAALAAICQRLDGLPLALELAAPRLKLLSPQALLTQLEHQRLALAGGACDLPLHQQTLRATLTWSYALLSPAEQRLLRRLAVCAGGCALDAVTPICTAAGPLDHDVLDSLARLVDHHLVQREAGTESDEVRVRLLETMREYGLEQLQAHQEVAVTQEAHASYYLRLAETAAPALTGPEQHRWFACLRREVDNFRAALGWAQAHGEIDHGLRLAGALWRFWYTCGQLTEGRHWLERALAAVRPAGATPAQALALHGAGWLAFGQGDYPQAREYHQAALEMSQALGDAQGIAQALNNLGGLRGWKAIIPRPRPSLRRVRLAIGR